MPIYEYECKNCHHHFDLMQKISDTSVKQCPKCFLDTVVRLVSPAGFQLKGTGWYVTDFKNKNNASKKESTPASNDQESTQKTQSPEQDKSKSRKDSQGESD